MKGISAVIATILMLMITVAMVGLAYMYISGMFASRTAQAISLSSVDCAGGDIHVMVKNDGTESITLTDIDVFVDSGAVNDCVGSGSVAAGAVQMCDAISASAGSHTLRIVGPSNSITGTVYCAS